MVHCCVPECTNHSVKTESVSYHKIPNDQALQKAWLARIKRENLPNLKNCYVCSEHFESSCFEVDLMEQLTGMKRKRKLKKDAVPSVFSFSKPPAKRRATTENRLKRKQDEEVLERLCTTSSEPEAHAVEMTDTPVDMEMPEFPYEPPTKDIGVQCCFDCKYVATSAVSTQTDSPMLPTTTTTTEVADLSHPSGCSPRNDLNLHDHSYSLKYHCSPVKSLPTVSPQKSDKSLFSDDEGKTPDSDDDDDDFVSSQETSTTDNDSEPESSSSNPLDQYIKEPKYIVFDSCLKQLFRFCSECGAPVSDMKYAYQGSLLSVTTACMKHHASTWYSQPVINRAAVGNLLICSSILFTGNTFIRLQNFSSCLGLKFLSERVFYRHQKRYLFPVVNSAWKKEESRVLEELSEKAVVNLNGDGRCDSPGHCAKYGTYTMMESSSGKIATFNVVQVTEVSSSNAMEKEGFVRCLDKLEESVTISLITTDRHTSITSAMEKDYSHISHQYDVWHLSKSIVKKLNKKAKLKKYEELAPWIQSISNHLWWCASTCNGDAALLRAKWKSVLHHCTNKHSWRDSDIFKKCAHPRLTRREVLSTCWLKPGSPAHVALEEVVLQPKLVKDLARLTEFCHTGGLEVYHSVINKYCPKREHFSYEGMIARTQLAALDNNLNTGRKQAVIEKGPRSGEARWRKCFPKTHKRWVVKPVLEKKSYAFLPELQLKVLEVCAEGMEGAQIEPIDEVELPSNIASEPAPDKQELIQRHRTRFSRFGKLGSEVRIS